jgi:RNA recognition motif-containing protein
MSVRLYVGNLPEEVDRQALEDLFEGVEKPVSTKIVTDRKTGKCRGFGFVTVETDDSAKLFIEKLNGQSFGEATLKVEVAQSRAKEPEPVAAKSQAKSSGKRNRSRGGTAANFVDRSGSAQPDPRWADQLQRIKEQLQAAQV